MEWFKNITHIGRRGQGGSQ